MSTPFCSQSGCQRLRLRVKFIKRTRLLASLVAIYLYQSSLKISIKCVMLQIPERYRPGLEKLAVLDDSVIDKLLDAIKNAPPTFHAEDIISLAHREHQISLEDASDIVSSIISLYSLRENEYMGTERIVDEISIALQDQTSIDLSTQTVVQLQERLLKFLEVRGPLEIASKAAELQMEYENIFTHSRVLTDLRPVFRSEIENGIGGALISHILRVGYKTLSGTNESFFALDANDIEQLLEQLERALEKEDALKSLLEKSSIPYLDVHPQSEILGGKDDN